MHRDLEPGQAEHRPGTFRSVVGSRPSIRAARTVPASYPTPKIIPHISRVLVLAETREPKRVLRRRTRSWRMPEGALYVGQPTKWGDPFRWSDYRPIVHDGEGEPVFRSVAVRRRHAVTGLRTAVAYGAGLPDPPSKDEIRRELDGRDLAYWCPLSEPGEIDWRHARVLLEIANGDDDA
ncbi:DUF4326 domain-containing protein [Streptosporangium roseum]|uniref:DUF4326 domain-containing protein n=1 Tax=Streptosporangium roseum TaxID=2001 RepID=UPI00332FB941